MKTLFSVVLALGLSTTAAFANDHEGKDFNARKAEVSKEVDERIKALQEHKACVDAAADPAALKSCREKMKEFRHEQKMEHMGKRKERLEKRMEKMKEEKK